MGAYDDIINLPHHVSKRHPQMSMWNRAAQFAPFAAVAGHGPAIQEEGRMTDDWIELGDFGNEELNRQMTFLISKLSMHPTVAIEYFQPDEYKSGGSYLSVSGIIKRIDEKERLIEMTDGTKISIDCITKIRIA